MATTKNHVAVRCPNCLLTVYTDTLRDDDARKGFTVDSLHAGALPYYNCPFRLCEFHVPGQRVNLYTPRRQPGEDRNAAMGLVLERWKPAILPFRTPRQAAGLLFSLDKAKELVEASAVLAVAQAEEEKPKAQGKMKLQFGEAEECEGVEDGSGVAFEEDAKPLTMRTITWAQLEKGNAAADEEDAMSLSNRHVKWTSEEKDHVKSLVNQGYGPHEIAEGMPNRSAMAVKNKIAEMRERRELPRLATGTSTTPRKRKAESETPTPGSK